MSRRYGSNGPSLPYGIDERHCRTCGITFTDTRIPPNDKAGNEDEEEKEDKEEEEKGEEEKTGGQEGEEEKTGGQEGEEEKTGGQEGEEEKTGGQEGEEEKTGGQEGEEEKTGGQEGEEEKTGGQEGEEKEGVGRGTPEKIINGSAGGSTDNGGVSRENKPNSTINEKTPDLAIARGHNSQHAIADSPGNKESNSRESARRHGLKSKHESESELQHSRQQLPPSENRKSALKANQSSAGEDRLGGKSQNNAGNEHKALVTTDGKSNSSATGGKGKTKTPKRRDTGSSATRDNKTKSKTSAKGTDKNKADQNNRKPEAVQSQSKSEDEATIAGKDWRKDTAESRERSRQNTAESQTNSKKDSTRSDNDETKGTSDSNLAIGSSENTEQQAVEDKLFDPADDVKILHDAMKGFGTDKKALISVIASRDASQRQLIRQTYQKEYDKDVLQELRSELSGDFRELVLDLMRLPWEREVDALVSSMAGFGTDEKLLVHVLLTHNALSAAELSEKYKEAKKKDLLKAVDSKTSGQLRRFLNCLVKVKLKKQKPDNRSPEDVARKLHNGGKPLLQSKPLDSIDLLASFPPDKMASMMTHYQQMSGRYLQDDIQKNLSAAFSALLAYVNRSCNPEEHEINVLNRSLEGEITFRIFSLAICNKENDLEDLRTRYAAATGRSLQSAVESDLHGDVRSLILRVLARAPRQQKD